MSIEQRNEANVIDTHEYETNATNVPVQLIKPEDLVDGAGQPVDLDEYLRLSAADLEATYYDGGSTVLYPQLGLTDAQFRQFVDDLRPIAAEMNPTHPSANWLDDAILELGKTAAEHS
jgi:hypothetical protein